MPLPRFPDNELQNPFRMAFAHPGSGFVAAVAASGLITCATKANLIDTDYMTIGDGMNPAVRYSFDTAGDGGTGVAVDVSGASTASSVAALLRTAILANQPGLSVVDNSNGTLTVTHLWPGLGGNVTMTENVAHASFLVSGLSGGASAVATGISTTTTYVLETLDARTRFDKVEIINPTGFVADAANYWTITLKKGTTVIGTWSTLTGQEGTITADVAALMTLSATDANRVGAVGDVMKLTFAKTGSPANFPAGRVIAHGRNV